MKEVRTPPTELEKSRDVLLLQKIEKAVSMTERGETVIDFSLYLECYKSINLRLGKRSGNSKNRTGDERELRYCQKLCFGL